jgi:ubiquinone/menaquinone biosynthesis C-methylase UbiE
VYTPELVSVATLPVKDQYQDEQVARGYDRERFASLVGRSFDFLEKRALGRALAQVRRAIPAPRVLDVPCGTGRITELLLGQGLEVTGADISPAMMAVAQTKCERFGCNVHFQTLDLDDLDLPDRAFDLVTCIRLFHHLDSEQRRRVLRELARVSARFVLVNVAFSSPYYRLRRRCKRRLGQGVSRTSSTWAEIEAEAAFAGLTVAARYFVLPYASEDLVVLLTRS